MNALSPRLSAVARWVLPGEALADIGTDHAYLPAHLVQTGVVPRAIAADLLPGPLEAARATLVSAGLADRVELRQGNGLEVLAPGEAATVTLCGMGGPLIARLLAESPPAGIRRLVLQPMGGEERLRAWLAGNGWRLVAEELVEDAGRLYVVLAAEPGQMVLTAPDAVVGPLLRARGGPLLSRYLARELDRDRAALAGALRSSEPEARRRAAELAARIRMLEEVRHHDTGDGRHDRSDHGAAGPAGLGGVMGQRRVAPGRPGQPGRPPAGGPGTDG